MPSSSDTTTTTDELQRAWQAFCRTTEFQHAAKWVADGDFPAALFVAFRAGAACTAAAARQVHVKHEASGAIPPCGREALRQALQGVTSSPCPQGRLAADAERYAQLKAAYTAANFDPSSLDLEGAVALIFTFPDKGMHVSGDLNKTLDAARAVRAEGR